MVDAKDDIKKATFAAGCFWHVEHTFSKIKGVMSTQVGYEGGSQEHPTYKEVCTGRTGHAESIELSYDPVLVSYEDLLKVFWHVHDPTTLNRQGPDFGSQYTVIFYHDDEQRRAALRSKAEEQASGEHDGKVIVTQIVPASHFWRAEEYHQRYIEKHVRPGCGK